MELTYEEQLQMVNSKEHLKVVLSNVRIANEELSSVLNDIKKARNTLEDVIIFRDKIKEDNFKIVSEQEAKSKELNNKESTLITRETNLKEAENLWLEKAENAKLEMEKFQLEKNKIISENNNLIAQYTVLIGELSNNLASLGEEIKKNEEENKRQLGNKKELENEISRLTFEKQEAEKDLEKFRKDIAKEMVAANLKLEEEKAKASEPLRIVRAETERNEIARKDLEIIRKRLIKRFKELNPERILPVELKEK